VINIKYLLIYYMKANCQKHIVKDYQVIVIAKKYIQKTNVTLG